MPLLLWSILSVAVRPDQAKRGERFSTNAAIPSTGPVRPRLSRPSGPARLEERAVRSYLCHHRLRGRLGQQRTGREHAGQRSKPFLAFCGIDHLVDQADAECASAALDQARR